MAQSLTDNHSAQLPKKFALSFGKTQLSKPKLTAKRPHSALEDADSEDADSETGQSITHFGQDPGAKRQKPKKETRIIPALPNKDWRTESIRRRQKSALPSHTQQTQTNGTDADRVNSTTPTFGLTLTETSEPQSEPDAETQSQQDESRPTQTEDEAALAALLSSDPTQDTIIRPPTEDEVFRQDFRNAPASATLDEYESTPVEGFGAAILRAYCKPGQTLDDYKARSEAGMPERMRTGDKDKKKGVNGVERRPGLLGLGAKSEGVEGVELGVWGRKKGRNGPIVYVPVARRSRVTGEVVADDELERRLKEKNKGEKGYVNGDSGRDSEYERSERDRDRDRDRDRERRRSRDRDRDRERSRDRKRHRRRSRDRGSDRDRERRRSRDRDDRPKHRSHRYDSDRESSRR